MIAAAVSGHGPSPLWYATRGTGAVALLLLSASTALGIGEQRGWRTAGMPRFGVAAMHRTISLLAVALLGVHVATTLLDPFPHIGFLAALVPFATDYRPLWIGMGAVAFDLLLALIVTSLARRRLGYRTWRGIHLLAYACWPVAVLHGLGSGSDTRATWMLVLTAACVLVVAVTILARVADAATPTRTRRAVCGLTVAAGLALAVWAAQGPLASGWSRRAGTPASVLRAFSPPAAVGATASAAAPPPDALAVPFSATLAGAQHRGFAADGTAVVRFDLRLRGGPHGVLRIRLGGQALSSGGLQVDRSAITLGTRAEPSRYAGRVGTLRGSRLQAVLGSRSGAAIRVTVDLALGGSRVGGSVIGEPVQARAA